MKSVLNLIWKIMPFYSVARGRKTGVFLSWSQCEAQVKGFKSPIFRKFNTYDEAQHFVISNGGQLDNNTDAELDIHQTSHPNNGTKKLIKKDDKSNVALSSNQQNKRSNTDENEEPCSKRLKKGIGREITLNEMKKYGKYSFLEDADGYVHVFTDGSCEGNGKINAVAGLGVYFGEGHALNLAKPVSGRATNNCGEIQASTMAIRSAADCGIQKLCINTDSQFLINSVTKWMTGWKKNGWLLKSRQPVKNVKDFKELDEVIGKYEIMIKWNYVKAHCGILGNERADALAKQGGEMYRSGLRSSNV